MARRASFGRAMVQLSRDLERAGKRAAAERDRQQRAAIRQAESSQKAYLRAQEAARKAELHAQKQAEIAARSQDRQAQLEARQAAADAKAAEKEQQRLYLESRQDEVAQLNEELDARIEYFKGILSATLDVDDYIDLDSLKQNSELPPQPIAPQFTYPKFDGQGYEVPLTPPQAVDFLGGATKPELAHFLPAKPEGFKANMPWVKIQYDKQVISGQAKFEEASRKWDELLAVARVGFNAAKVEFDQKEQERIQRLRELQSQYKTARQQAQRQHQEAVNQQEAQWKARCDEIHKSDERQAQGIEDWKNELKAGQPEAVANYFSLVLSASAYPEDFPRHARLAFVPDARQLVVEFDLPTVDIVPEELTYKYTKTKDEITVSTRALAARKALYGSIIAQLTLRTLHELFEADRFEVLESLVFSGFVDTIDRATGKTVRPCLVTVRTTRDEFLELNLAQVEPEACLKSLGASVSRAPSELAPVRPVVDFNMVDPRFIEEAEMISGLETRTNLMELSPQAFEVLIRDLFGKMGLESKLTQASRDGGVDCVAFDLRPILGGKVVIQAKRYKNVVDVSAVRDLYGAMMNEQASKGILVTTSHFGQAAYQFANNKPIELVTGANLLSLLQQYADLDATIIMPEADEILG